MRLGEAFLHKGMITQRQLDKALEAQLMFGGHLGTCLMELGYVDEFQLGQVLAEVSGAPYANPQMFRSIRLPVIKTTPPRLVEKYHAVPFEMHDGTLRVAMLDPKNLPALDEVSFATGYRTEAWVAPEARILQAMERYYDIPRSRRFVDICRRLDGEWINRVTKATEKADVHPVPVTEVPSLLEAPGPELSADPEATGEPPVQAAPPVADPSPETAPGPAPHAVSMSAPVAAAAAAALPVEEPVPEMMEDRPVNSVDWDAFECEIPRSPEDELADLICASESIEGLADAVLDFASERLARCILFAVKTRTAVVWSSRGLSLHRDKLKDLSIQIATEPVFGLFLGDGFYRGPLPKDSRYHGFYQRLEMQIPTEVMVIPVHVEDRLVALFYGDGRRNTDIEGDTDQYRMLLRKLALGLKLVILKRKIRSL